jgi:hypothetical protein
MESDNHRSRLPDRLRSVRDELASRTHVAAIAGDVADPAHRRELAVSPADTRTRCGHQQRKHTWREPLPELLDYPLDALTVGV